MWGFCTFSGTGICFANTSHSFHILNLEHKDILYELPKEVLGDNVPNLQIFTKMSVMTENTRDSTDLPTNSVYDMGFGESDVESSDSSVDASIPKDYWFGQKYFECVIAQKLLQHSRLSESVAVVDVSLSCSRK